MDYIQQNKAAWEEAFEHRHDNWGEDNHEILKARELPFLEPDVVLKLRQIDFTDKDIAQFCCNNGRELLSVMQLGANSGTGFDIAENILEQARDTAEKIDRRNCRFVACNLLEMDPQYHNRFDFIFFTIGAITWFADLKELFAVVAKCLKPNGVLLIHDFHPFVNMLPIPGEELFDSDNLNQVAYSYFREEPWIENQGIGYMSKQYNSKTFTSYSHTVSAILNGAIANGLAVKEFDEFNYDVGITEVYDGKGYPLSFILLAQKG